jgi:hypothetical protein
MNIIGKRVMLQTSTRSYISIHRQWDRRSVVVNVHLHMERVGEMRNEYSILVENLSTGDHLGDPGFDEKILLKWI